jgi:hypothetical protein
MPGLHDIVCYIQKYNSVVRFLPTFEKLGLISRICNYSLLFVYHTSIPMKKLPQFGGEDIDLYLLYKTVTNFGGWLKVIPIFILFAIFYFPFHNHCLITSAIWSNL